MTEYIASSPLVGRRPRISRMRAYSSGLRPSAAYGCSRSGVSVAFATVSTTCVVGGGGGHAALQRKGPAGRSSLPAAERGQAGQRSGSPRRGLGRRHPARTESALLQCDGHTKRRAHGLRLSGGGFERFDAGRRIVVQVAEAVRCGCHRARQFVPLRVGGARILRFGNGQRTALAGVRLRFLFGGSVESETCGSRRRTMRWRGLRRRDFPWV